MKCYSMWTWDFFSLKCALKSLPTEELLACSQETTLKLLCSQQVDNEILGSNLNSILMSCLSYIATVRNFPCYPRGQSGLSVLITHFKCLTWFQLSWSLITCQKVYLKMLNHGCKRVECPMYNLLTQLNNMALYW